MMPLKYYNMIWLCCLILACTGCNSLEQNYAAQDAPIEPDFEHWMPRPEAQTQLQRGQTAYLPLYDGFISIASRLHLIHNAKHHLDLQYYIWTDDEIGHLVLAELLKAADRGVQVRLLIDDQNGTQLDDTLLALSHHPNFKIRLFNPYKFRHFRALDYAFRMQAVNHRMHNKLIITDGAIAVTGGRNISREYFDASDDFQFTDVDILFAGNAVKKANDNFRAFWNHELSFNLVQLMDQNSNKYHRNSLTLLREKYASQQLDEQEVQRRISFAEQQVAQYLKQRSYHWAKAHFVADPPEKIQGKAKDEEMIYHQMIQIMGTPNQHLELVSAYFIPTQRGTDYMSRLAENGIDIRVLTNSYMANDVPIVHAFYQQYRPQLLASGIRLYEFKRYIQREERTWYEIITGNVIPAKGRSASSLHAKFFDIDGKVFIGSFNFDPRSAFLNTEVGLVLESDELQDEISDSLNQYLPQIAYELRLDEKGHIIWLDYQKDGSVIQHKVDPETTSFQRFVMNLMTHVPVEWMM
ncbi:phospholipase D family protein [Acinetobacter indicus]|uniref:phospholipase D family protein n=1 Tax=Acinetobacter indicus TaxID=756892 RepID=UPI0035BC570C